MYSLQLEITRRCNERCVHCYIPHNTKIADMDTALIFNILDQYKNMDGQELTISGGEPMLHPDFYSIVDKASYCGFIIRIFSNLTLLTETITNKLKSVNLKEVQTSLYSIAPEIHDAITCCPGSCEKTKSALLHLDRKGIPVFISCPVMKQNKTSYTSVVQWAKPHGIKSAPDNMIFACTNRSTGNLDNRLDIEDALQVVKDILKNDPGAYEHERFMPDYRNTDEALPCVQNICKNSLCINTLGEVVPTPGWNHVLGNVHKQILQDIWENSAELKRVKAISIDNFPKCKDCPDIEFCGMSLEGNANENPQGNPFVVPPYICELAHRTRELVHTYYKSKEVS